MSKAHHFVCQRDQLMKMHITNKNNSQRLHKTDQQPTCGGEAFFLLTLIFSSLIASSSLTLKSLGSLRALHIAFLKLERQIEKTHRKYVDASKSYNLMTGRINGIFLLKAVAKYLNKKPIYCVAKKQSVKLTRHFLLRRLNSPKYINTHISRNNYPIKVFLCYPYFPAKTHGISIV